jgi:hypothetical protein
VLKEDVELLEMLQVLPSNFNPVCSLSVALHEFQGAWKNHNADDKPDQQPDENKVQNYGSSRTREKSEGLVEKEAQKYEDDYDR